MDKIYEYISTPERRSVKKLYIHQPKPSYNKETDLEEIINANFVF